MGRVKDLEVERLENMTEEEQIKYEQEQAEADMAEAMTAQMEKRDAAFNKMVDVKKFNEK